MKAKGICIKTSEINTIIMLLAAAPAPLAGGGLIYLAAGGSVAGIWLAVKMIAKKLRGRD